MPFEPIHLKSRLVVALLFSMTGAVVMMTILFPTHVTIFRHDGITAILCAVAGAGVAGALLAPLMGLLRDTGLPWSMFAAGTATLLGAAFGALGFVSFSAEFELFPLAVILGPVFVTTGLVTTMAGPIWLVCVLATHYVTQALRLRDEVLLPSDGY